MNIENSIQKIVNDEIKTESDRLALHDEIGNAHKTEQDHFFNKLLLEENLIRDRYILYLLLTLIDNAELQKKLIFKNKYLINSMSDLQYLSKLIKDPELKKEIDDYDLNLTDNKKSQEDIISEDKHLTDSGNDLNRTDNKKSQEDIISKYQDIIKGISDLKNVLELLDDPESQEDIILQYKDLIKSIYNLEGVLNLIKDPALKKKIYEIYKDLIKSTFDLHEYLKLTDDIKLRKYLIENHENLINSMYDLRNVFNDKIKIEDAEFYLKHQNLIKNRFDLTDYLKLTDDIKLKKQVYLACVSKLINKTSDLTDYLKLTDDIELQKEVILNCSHLFNFKTTVDTLPNFLTLEFKEKTLNDLSFKIRMIEKYKDYIDSLNTLKQVLEQLKNKPELQRELIFATRDCIKNHYNLKEIWKSIGNKATKEEIIQDRKKEIILGNFHVINYTTILGNFQIELTDINEDYIKKNIKFIPNNIQALNNLFSLVVKNQILRKTIVSKTSSLIKNIDEVKGYVKLIDERITTKDQELQELKEKIISENFHLINNMADAIYCIEHIKNPALKKEKILYAEKFIKNIDELKEYVKLIDERITTKDQELQELKDQELQELKDNIISKNFRLVKNRADAIYFIKLIQNKQLKEETMLNALYFTTISLDKILEYVDLTKDTELQKKIVSEISFSLSLKYINTIDILKKLFFLMPEGEKKKFIFKNFHLIKSEEDLKEFGFNLTDFDTQYIDDNLKYISNNTEALENLLAFVVTDPTLKQKIILKDTRYFIKTLDGAEKYIRLTENFIKTLENLLAFVVTDPTLKQKIILKDTENFIKTLDDAEIRLAENLELIRRIIRATNEEDLIININLDKLSFFVNGAKPDRYVQINIIFKNFHLIKSEEDLKKLGLKLSDIKQEDVKANLRFIPNTREAVQNLFKLVQIDKALKLEIIAEKPNYIKNIDKAIKYIKKLGNSNLQKKLIADTAGLIKNINDLNDLNNYLDKIINSKLENSQLKQELIKIAVEKQSVIKTMEELFFCVKKVINFKLKENKSLNDAKYEEFIKYIITLIDTSLKIREEQKTLGTNYTEFPEDTISKMQANFVKIIAISNLSDFSDLAISLYGETKSYGKVILTPLSYSTRKDLDYANFQTLEQYIPEAKALLQNLKNENNQKKENEVPRSPDLKTKNLNLGTTRGIGTSNTTETKTEKIKRKYSL